MNYEKYTAAYKLLTAITNITYNYNILYTHHVNKIDIPSRIKQVRTRAHARKNTAQIISIKIKILKKWNITLMYGVVPYLLPKYYQNLLRIHDDIVHFCVYVRACMYVFSSCFRRKTRKGLSINYFRSVSGWGIASFVKKRTVEWGRRVSENRHF